MTKTFTQIDVLKFFYNEVTEIEAQEIQTAIICDDSLAEYYHELVTLEAALEKIKMQPSEKSIENILNFSKSFSLHTV